MVCLPYITHPGSRKIFIATNTCDFQCVHTEKYGNTQRPKNTQTVYSKRSKCYVYNTAHFSPSVATTVDTQRKACFEPVGGGHVVNIISTSHEISMRSSEENLKCVTFLKEVSQQKAGVFWRIMRQSWWNVKVTFPVLAVFDLRRHHSVELHTLHEYTSKCAQKYTNRSTQTETQH